jgi:hypothetical protein
VKVEVCCDVDAGPWHDLLRRSPHSSIYQTSAWAAYLQEYLCHTPYYLRCDDEGMAMGVMLLTRQPLAASSLVGRPLGGAAATLLKKVAPRYSWTSGPVLFADEEPEACLAAGLLMDEARRIVGRSRVSGATMPVEMSEPVRSKCDAWLKATPWATFLVDLKPDETRLWESLRPAARKAVRRARESGLIVDVIQSDSARIELHAFLKEANELKGTRTFPIENLQIRNEHLSSLDTKDRLPVLWGSGDSAENFMSSARRRRRSLRPRNWPAAIFSSGKSSPGRRRVGLAHTTCAV